MRDSSYVKGMLPCMGYTHLVTSETLHLHLQISDGFSLETVLTLHISLSVFLGR